VTHIITQSEKELLQQVALHDLALHKRCFNEAINRLAKDPLLVATIFIQGGILLHVIHKVLSSFNVPDPADGSLYSEDDDMEQADANPLVTWSDILAERYSHGASVVRGEPVEAGPYHFWIDSIGHVLCGRRDGSLANVTTDRLHVTCIACRSAIDSGQLDGMLSLERKQAGGTDKCQPLDSE
jgi:hypothetical protein